jgi:hypothetical protein
MIRKRHLWALWTTLTVTAAAFWPDAAADMGAADAIGLARRLRLQNLEPKEEGRHGV